MFPMKPTQRTGTKTLTSKQLIQRLLLRNASLSQVKPGNMKIDILYILCIEQRE